MGLRHFWIETYGCQMNKAESESIHLQLIELNMLPAVGADEADLVLINTCSVRKTAEDRIFGRIGHYKHLKQTKSDLKLVIMGCMAERLKEQLLKDKVVDLVIGNFEKNHIGGIIAETFNNDLQKAYTRDMPYQFFHKHSMADGEFKAFIPIMHGCNNWCAYCIVPHVRGREVSREPEDILKEIAELEAAGVKEITLLGQNVNSYHYKSGDQVLSFPGLLQLIAEAVKTIKWVRFLTSHPKDLSSELLEVMAAHPLFCRHIHLPVQHGSNKILEAMGRRYTREKYLGLVESIRSRFPEASITTDLLIGFPGEDEQDFADTLELIKIVGFSDAFTYRYNPREGTRAYELGDTVAEDLKLTRLQQVIDLQREISHTLKKRKVGRIVEVLVENVSKKNKNELLGRTESDEMVVFPGDVRKIGDFTKVKLTALEGNTFQGEEE